MSEDGFARYGYSRLTGNWYRVTEYEELGDGKIRAISKEKVPREEVPTAWLQGTDERTIDTETEHTDKE